MDIEQAKSVITRTHVSAITRGYRAMCYRLISRPGAGKSEGIDQTGPLMANMLGEPYGLVVCMAASMQSVDLRGFMYPKTVKEMKWPVSMFTLPPWYPTRWNTKVFMPNGDICEPPLPDDIPVPLFGCLSLDEFGHLDEDQQKVAAELLLHGRIGDFQLPEYWRVLAASNRLKDRAGVVRTLTFVVNRVGTLEIVSRYPVWERWVNRLPAESRPHYLTVSFADQQSHLVFSEAVGEGDSPYCTERSLVKMDRELMGLRDEEEIQRNLIPQDSVAKEVAAGIIGSGASANYYTHVKLADELPTWQQVVRRPKEAKLPMRKDAQMVASMMVAHQLDDEDHVDQAMEYITRMDVEMQALFVRQVKNQAEKGPWLTINESYARWTAKHGELITASAG